MNTNLVATVIGFLITCIGISATIKPGPSIPVTESSGMELAGPLNAGG